MAGWGLFSQITETPGGATGVLNGKGEGHLSHVNSNFEKASSFRREKNRWAGKSGMEKAKAAVLERRADSYTLMAQLDEAEKEG